MIRIATFCLIVILMQGLAVESRAQGRCVDDQSYTGAPKTTIIGDSFSTTFDNQTSVEKDVSKICGGISQIPRNSYRTAYLKNSSQAGAKLLGHPYRSIRKQTIPPDTDVVIFGGEANYLMACGFGWNAIQCNKKTMHRTVSPNLKAGQLKKPIDKSVPDNAHVIIVYQTALPDFAKPAWKRLFGSGTGDKLRDRYSEFSSAIQNII